jgi:flagellar assembly factor FliW
MKLIKHRVNSVKELSSLNKNFGVEIDLRAGERVGEIKLTHDPWSSGDDFGHWLKSYSEKNISGPIILNTKDDGLEQQILLQLNKNAINDFFFLDTTLPTLFKLIQSGKISPDNLAVRLSVIEPLEFVKLFRNKVKWVWVDCFEGKKVPINWLQDLKNDFKFCLVSPELQMLPDSQIAEHKKYFNQYADAVCTKYPEKWS